ncbi:MAG: TIGR02099 family protein [Burkholderiaceae bacterium]|nr:TIGR02099 family protein [Burkholderiaceae bacterium]
MHAFAPPPAGPTRLERALRWLAWSVLVLALALAGAYTALRTLVWPNLDRWRPQIEQRLAETTGRTVRIGSLTTGFDGWRPWLVADKLAVLDADGVEALSAERLRGVVSMRGALRGRFVLALLEIEAPALRVERVTPSRLRIGGFDVDLDAPGSPGVFERLLAHRRIRLHDVRIDAIDRVGESRLALAGVDIAIGSVGRRHRASLHVPAWGEVAQDVDAAIEFAHAPFASPADWRSWRGEAYVGARSADLAAALAQWERWHQVFGLPAAPPMVAVEAGRVGFRAWTQFDPDAASRTALKLEAASLRARIDGQPIPIAGVRLEASATHDAAGRTTLVFEKLGFDDVQYGSFGAIAGEPMLRLDAEGQPLAARLSLGRFDAARTMAWLRAFPLPPDVRARLEPLQLEGQIGRVALDWSAEPGEAHTRVDADFEQLAFARHEDGELRPGELRLPAFRNVSGHVHLTREGGEATLSGQGAVLRFPGLFAEPDVPLERLDARASWTIAEAADGESAPRVALRIESLHFANRDAAGELSGTWRSGGRGAGIVDLAGRLGRAEASRTSRYLPLVIPAQVRDWVRDAVRGGRSDDVRFVLQGDLADFPFRDPAAGAFLVEARLADARLAYAPGWPAIERIRGSLRFERAGMEIHAQSGAVWNVALADTRARIADFDKPLLLVEGSGAGPAQDMIRFVNESALRTKIDDFTRETTVAGDAALQLALELPLEHLDATRVRGAVQFAGNDVALDRTLPTFESLAGRLEFTEDRLALRGLRARFLGGELQLQGDAPGPGQLQLSARGSVPAASLAQWRDPSFGPALPARIGAALSGSLAFEARFELSDRRSKLSIDSTLAGLASALPPPFAKSADERWPLRIESATSADGVETLRVRLRDDVQLVLERERASAERERVPPERAREPPEREREPHLAAAKLRRGVLALNTDAVLPDAGFAVRLHSPQLDLDAWNALLDETPASAGDGRPPSAASARPSAGAFAAPSPAASGSPSFVPDAISIVSDRVRLGGRTFEEVVVGATRVDAAWRANLHAKGIDGYLRWSAPEAGAAAGRLSARFTRLSIPDDRIDDIEQLLDATPRSLPALDVVADELVLGARALGALQLRARNDETGNAQLWRLEHLQLRNDAATFDASGTWRARSGDAKPLSTMRFNLSVADAGRLLDLFDFRDVLRGGAGGLSGEVHWNGSPMRLDARSLGGEIALSLGKGQFLKSDPGIAKLIGVVNLQSLRRRLVFDFRDVFAEGFAFDRIDGAVHVRDGVARTDDFHMRGVAAQVLIRGEASIPAETQSLVVEVRPELNAGLASLAYAALANPALGLGSFVAQMVLREPLQRMFAFEYDVTGPWDDPQVVRRSRPTPEALVSPDVPAPPAGGPAPSAGGPAPPAGAPAPPAGGAAQGAPR